MPRILRDKTFWIGAVTGAIIGPYVIRRIAPKLSPIQNVSVQR